MEPTVFGLVFLLSAPLNNPSLPVTQLNDEQVDALSKFQESLTREQKEKLKVIIEKLQPIVIEKDHLNLREMPTYGCG